MTKLHNHTCISSGLICSSEGASLLCVEQSHFPKHSFARSLLRRRRGEERLCLVCPALRVPLHIAQLSPSGAEREDEGDGSDFDGLPVLSSVLTNGPACFQSTQMACCRDWRRTPRANRIPSVTLLSPVVSREGELGTQTDENLLQP